MKPNLFFLGLNGTLMIHYIKKRGEEAIPSTSCIRKYLLATEGTNAKKKKRLKQKEILPGLQSTWAYCLINPKISSVMLLF
jgi:hypothetical protein